MSGQKLHLPEGRLRRFVRDVFVAQGVSAADAETVSDVLITADLRGLDTHGISRLGYYRDRLRAGVTLPVASPEVVHDTTTTAVWDGHHGLGHVVGAKAMRCAVEKARSHGMGSVAVRNSTHYGIAGYYAEIAVQEGLIGLTTTNARPSVVPTFGTEARFGTNPLAFGAPTDEDFPFIYDASMAVTQRGKFERARRAGTSIPDGLVVDQNGNYMNDPAEILEAMKQSRAGMLPLGGAGEEWGGHKGYGISIILEILSSALQDGSFLTGLAGGDREGTWKPYCIGHFFLAIHIPAFVSLDSFKHTTGEIMRELRSASRAPEAPRIWTAGEKEWETEQERLKHGIPVSEALMTELTHIADELGVATLDGA